MERRGDEVHIDTDEARGASTPNIVRWVLTISLLAAILLLSAIWMFGAATTNTEDDMATVDDRIRLQEDDGDDTDGIVSEQADELDAAATEDPGRIEN